MSIAPQLEAAIQHHHAGRFAEAEAAYRRILAGDPAEVNALHFLGYLFYQLGRHGEAAELIRESISRNPANPPAHVNLGKVYQAQGLLQEAVDCYRKALSLAPDLVEAHFNLGIALRDLVQHEDAAASFGRAIRLKPDLAEGHYCLGHVYADLDRRDEALACFRKALALEPEHAAARWSYAMSQLQSVHGTAQDAARLRSAFAAELEQLERWFDAGRCAAGAAVVGVQLPFALAYEEQDNCDLLARHGNLCVRLMDSWAKQERLPRAASRSDAGPVRVAVVSQYFRHHSVWHAIMKGWFQHTDRKRVELHAFCLWPGEDEETRLARSSAASFVQSRADLRHWAGAILEARPDVLIYPELGMDAMTLRLASLRLAPVQAASWGHPQTSGLPTVDYYLSAEDFEPPGAQGQYTERLVALPHLGCHVERRAGEPLVPDLAAWGIDTQVPLCVCPGTPFKYAPQYDWVFPEIARRLGACRFVFFTHWVHALSERLRQRMRQAFRERGLAMEDYVTFIPWLTEAAFQGLMQRADLYLDTIGFSGFNTAMQALECGLPVVTREGRFMRGRLASGILKRIGLAELVAANEEDYVSLAVRLVQDPDYDEVVRGRIDAGLPAAHGDLAPIRALEDFLAGAARS